MTKTSLENIVESFRRERIDPEANLTDFLPNIEFRPDDAEILLSWKRHFRRTKTPYIICRTDDSFILWKEAVV